jgi:hypothetical protein
MGFFSFKTQDTGRSIANHYSDRKTFKVYMHDNKGNVYVEENYEGYGDFGGVDFYELMASMNGMKDRYEAVNAWVAKQEGILYPNLSQLSNWQWRNECPVQCEYQGYFYE